MRLAILCVFVSTLLVLAIETSAQDASAPASQPPQTQPAETTGRQLDKRTEFTVNGKVYKMPAPENWSALNDLTTGLQPTASSVIQHDEEPDFVREVVRVQWRLSDPIDLWITRPKVPKVAEKTPVILYLYSYTDTNERFRDNGWARRATANGFAAVGFVPALTQDRFANRPMKEWFVGNLQESLGSTVHDVQLILNYLATQDDLDMNRIGMIGQGCGGSIAILAAHAEPRIKAIDVLDPWGDWPDWLATSPVVPEDERPKYLKPEFLKSVAGLDPVDYLSGLKTPSVRVQLTMTDPLTPKAARDRIISAAQPPIQVVEYAKPQDLLKAYQTGGGLSGWVKTKLRAQGSTEAAKRAD